MSKRKERDYVKIAQFSGVTRWGIIFRHILPANIGAVIVLATIGLAKAIIAVSALGFLGFGVQPPHPEWGTLLMEGKDYILNAPIYHYFPELPSCCQCSPSTSWETAFRMPGTEPGNRYHIKVRDTKMFQL